MEVESLILIEAGPNSNLTLKEKAFPESTAMKYRDMSCKLIVGKCVLPPMESQLLPDANVIVIGPIRHAARPFLLPGSW